MLRAHSAVFVRLGRCTLVGVRISVSRSATVALVGFASVLWSTMNAVPVAAASSKTAKPPTTTAQAYSGKSGAAQVSAAITASALPIASSLGAKLGKPNCPPVETPKVGLTLQCLVAFEKSIVGWLVTLTSAGGLDARPTFPIVSKRRLESLAGAGSVCDIPAFVGLPVGASVSCSTGKTATTFRMGANGAVQRV